MIQFEQVTKEYTPGKPVVSDVTMEIQDGEFFVLIGPSGSGKTTTLKMINRLIPLTKGWIKIDGTPISEFHLQELRWNIGYVLQQIALFPNMTVEENILVVPEMKKWPQDQMKKRVTQLLDRIGLDPHTYRNRNISSLSGGEQQRVGVARALAADPDIILMDEPFSALDPVSRNQLRQDVSRLQKELKKTIVFVTHDMQEAIQLGDRIGLMNNGKIEQIGTPKAILEKPKNEFVRNFLQTGLPNYKEQTRIHELAAQGYIQEETFHSDSVSPVLSSEDPLDALIVALAAHPLAYVTHPDNRPAGVVTQESLLAFLAANLDADEAVTTE
ncbi:ABC transporter ATP-binding protein [Atopococcus tabaci]|uniref:ABC transporter ATP-binding protein n=1 Tax=Atopococcus tabaci TaxID=269774 RepID=UPI000415A8E0|nr:ABC transporter ATP-binding protein [Atopococcus tabaci]